MEINIWSFSQSICHKSIKWYLLLLFHTLINYNVFDKKCVLGSFYVSGTVLGNGD